MFGIGLLLGRDAGSFPLHAPVAPESFMNLEELRQHWPGMAPGILAKPGDLCQHSVIVEQSATAP